MSTVVESESPLADSDRCRDCRDRETLRSAVIESAALLNEERFVEWADLFTADGRYSIEVSISEFPHQQTWWDSDTVELRSMMKGIANHLRDPGRRWRHLSAIRVGPASTEPQWTADTDVVVVRATEEGPPELWAYCRYHDVWVHDEDGWRIKQRQVELVTPTLTRGSHDPL